MVGLTTLFAVAAGLGIALALVTWRLGQKSKRQLAEASSAAAASRARFRSLESLSDGGFVAWLADGTLWSHGLRNLFDLPQEKMTSLEELSPFVAADEYSELLEKIAHLREDGTAFVHELNTADGETIIEGRGRPGSGDDVIAAIVWLRKIPDEALQARATSQGNEAKLSEASEALDKYVALLAAAPSQFAEHMGRVFG